MDEKEISEIFGRINAAIENDKEPSNADFVRLAEGALVNLARIAAHANRKAK